MAQDVIPSIITEKVYAFYNALSKRGKPSLAGEWTTLSCFLTMRGDVIQVVSCATGTRCLGKSLLDKSGNRLHDSHAEVLARRAFQRYLMTEVQQVYRSAAGSDGILEINEMSKKLSVKSDTKIIFFTTQTPCGDASIYKRPEDDIHPSRKRDHSTEIHRSSKRAKNEFNVETGAVGSLEITELMKQGDRCHPLTLDEDLYRTGAKCVPGGSQDKQLPGTEYHVTGALRTKPGRGDPTLSHSCSDKIARWNVLGCQGCFPMLFLSKPIYVDHIVVASCTFDEEAMTRAIYQRLSNIQLGTANDIFNLHKPVISHVKKPFIHSKSTVEASLTSAVSVTPCASSLIWYKQVGGCNVTEVSINGYRQGVTKKSKHTAKSRLSICRSNLLKQLHEVVGDFVEQTRFFLLQRCDLPTNYLQCKEIVGYSRVWHQLLANDDLFKTWIRKGQEYSQFCVDAA